MTTPVRIGADARQQALQAALATQTGVGLPDTDGSATATIVHASSRVTQRLQADPGLWATVRQTNTHGEHRDLVLDIDGEPLILRTAAHAANRLNTEAGTALRIRLAGNEAVRISMATSDPADASGANNARSAPTDSVIARISPQTRQLSALIEGLQQAGNSDPATRSSTPLGSALMNVHETNPDPTRIASQLGRLVEQSGLFYEAHIRDWVQGKRRLHELRQEPQAALADAKSAANGDGVNASAAQDVIAPSLRAIVRQQLAAAASSEVALHGQAWDEQPVALSLGDQPHTSTDPTWRSLAAALAAAAPTLSNAMPPQVRDRQGGAHSAASAIVAARLNMQLPALGELACHLVLQGEQLALQISHEARSVLQPHLHSLQLALQARGLEPMIVLSELAQDATRKVPADAQPTQR